MKSTIRAFLPLALALPLVLLATACTPPDGDGDDELPDIAELFPADNEVGSWVEDTSQGAAGVEVARSYSEATDLINGGAAPFEEVMTAFALEFYTDGSRQLKMHVWEMTDADTCATRYASLVTEDSLYSANTWEDASLGEAGRVADTGTSWWFNCRSQVFQVEAWINVNDATAKTDAQAFLAAVVDKI